RGSRPVSHKNSDGSRITAVHRPPARPTRARSAWPGASRDMKRLIAVGLISNALVLVGACGNTGYGTTTGKADLTSFNGNPGTPSCSNPARPANTALYCPAAGILPYPFDAYFAGSTDGTLNIQPPNATWPNQAFLNDVDGFSTTASIRERFNGPIDVASLATP